MHHQGGTGRDSAAALAVPRAYLGLALLAELANWKALVQEQK